MVPPCAEHLNNLEVLFAAAGHGLGRRVGNGERQLVGGRCALVVVGLGSLELRLEFASGPDLRVAVLGGGLADLLRCRIRLSLQILERGLERPSVLVEREQLLDHLWVCTFADGAVTVSVVFSEGAEVDHGTRG